jgi:hypothetical protein
MSIRLLALYASVLLFSRSAFAEGEGTDLVDFLKESWWLILIVPVTLLLKKALKKLEE